MHNVDFVNMALKETVASVKNFNLSNLSREHYFSDSCSGQHKNYKNFLNFCCHEHDFDVSCLWSILQKAMESPKGMTLVAPSKGLQPELVFND